MEVITVLVLILLGTVGARNIPDHMDEPSKELQQVFPDNLTSADVALAGKFSSGDLAESATNATNLENLSLLLKKIAEKGEFEDHELNAGDLIVGIKANTLNSLKTKAATVNNDTNVYKNRQDEEMGSVSEHAGVHNEGFVFEDRNIVKDFTCPAGKVRVGDDCKKKVTTVKN